MDKFFLEEEYLSKAKTFREIAADLGCSKDKVQYYAKKYGILSRRGGRKRIPIETGQKFGSLTICSSVNEKTKHPQYICECECGNFTKSTASELARGKRMCWDCRNKYISEIKWKGHGEISGEFWIKIKSSAEARDIQVDITIQEIWGLFLKQDRKCALSGVKLYFTRSKQNRNQITASLDRIDSSKHYTIDNVQWVHKVLNNLKMDLPQEEFISWCKLVTENANRLDREE